MLTLVPFEGGLTRATYPSLAHFRAIQRWENSSSPLTAKIKQMCKLIGLIGFCYFLTLNHKSYCLITIRSTR